MVWRYIKAGHRGLSLTTILSLVGMTIGVASLVVGMAVLSGYESTLKKTVTDVVGHVLVMKTVRSQDDKTNLVEEVRPHVEGLEAATPFAYLEAVLAHGGTVSGVVVEGVDPNTVHQVLNLKSRLIQGDFDLSLNDAGVAGVVVGKGVFKNFGLELGDVFRVVMPVSDGLNTEAFKPRLRKFRVTGVLDMGRHDYDTRYIISDLKEAQAFAQIGDRVSGYRLRLKDENKAQEASLRITNNLGYGYWARDWRDVNRNLFDAVQLEKIVIFLVLLIIVIAASFNISSTLFVSVIQRFNDISVLKTLGANRRFVLRIFTFQGLFIGILGAFFGLLLGLLACQGFIWAQEAWGLIPGDIYKLDHVDLELRWLDLLAIAGSSMLICFISTLAPARRGAKLSPVEGLRYE